MSREGDNRELIRRPEEVASNCVTTPEHFLEGLASHRSRSIDYERHCKRRETITRAQPKILNAGFLGYVRWQNEAVIADLDAIKETSNGGPLLQRLLLGGRNEEPDATQPPEADRFLVTDADFSQQRVVWCSRQSPGLIVRGPPGTGKSQTIVNIIADALGHGRRVLMVCQKQAATRVVYERIRGAGLDGLCLEVHDAEQDRTHVFRTIREQAENLFSGAEANGERRRQLALRISEIEQELDSYHSALRSPEASIGISFKGLLARQGRLLNAFPSARRVEALGQALGDCTAEELDQFLFRLRDAGQLFATGRFPTNIWRDRTEEARVGPAVQMDVENSVARLATLDATHRAHIDRHGLGIDLQDDADAFMRAAEACLAILEPMTARSDELDARVARAWLGHLNELPEDAEAARQRCDVAIQVAQEIAKHPLTRNGRTVSSPAQRRSSRRSAEPQPAMRGSEQSGGACSRLATGPAARLFFNGCSGRRPRWSRPRNSAVRLAQHN